MSYDLQHRAHGVSVCAYCGREFEQSGCGRPRIYCSVECNNKRQASVRVKERVITCAYCQTEFTTKKNGAPKYCSDRCRKNKRNADDKIKRGGGKPKTCPHCGDVFTPDYVLRVYCSDTCQRAACNERAKARSRTMYETVCGYCGEEFLSWRKGTTRCPAPACVSAQRREASAPAIAKRKRVEAEARVLKQWAKRKPWASRRRECAECSKVFRSTHGRTVCSDECKKSRDIKAKRLIDKRSGRRAAYRDKRKALERGARTSEIVYKVKVFRRDRWHCQECGVHTPREARGSYEDWAPEIDHIVPLALGGKHAYDNVQLLCRACNISKGPAPPEEWHSSPYGIGPEKGGYGGARREHSPRRRTVGGTDRPNTLKNQE